MLKKRIFIALCILLLILVALLFAAVKQARHLHRDPIVLMNKYYQFKSVEPDVAKKSLLLILNQDNNYLPAMKEYSQWLLNGDQPQQAKHWLEQLHKHLPDNNNYTLQLGYLYYMDGEWQKSKQLFIELLARSTGHLRLQVLQALNAMASYVPYYQYHATVQTCGMVTRKLLSAAPLAIFHVVRGAKSKAVQVNDMLNKYYKIKQNPQISRLIIKQIVDKYPNNIQVLKEAGFLAIRQGHQIEAIDYFTRVYDLAYQPNIAMQLAYLYDQINDKPAAYHYFKRATCSNDKTLSLDAEHALTTLAGQQTKALPLPYFAEIYLSPFSQRRFGLTVVPFYARLGVEQANRFQTKEYVFLRRTQDNRSANLGQVSQIYEDNVQITGVGAQLSPFRRLPLVSFIEVGEAYDLVYQHRNRWRGDVRGGFMYYKEFGAPPTYVDNLYISYDYYSDWYGDATYFSRYKNNVIGLVKTHQGIRLMQYKSSMVNLYITGRVIADTNRVFYNNIAEVGPGIAFIPSNRFNLQLRFEHVNGVYLPAGSAVNPYSKYYTNQLVQLLLYVRI